MSTDLKDKPSGIYDDEQNSHIDRIRDLEAQEAAEAQEGTHQTNEDGSPLSGSAIKASESKKPASGKDTTDKSSTPKSGGLYNPDGDKSTSRFGKLKSKLGNIENKRRKLLVVGGSIGGVTAFMLILILLASLKLPHFGQVLTATGYARLNGIMRERMAQNLFDNAATTGDGQISLRARTMRERITGQNLNKQITKLGQENRLIFELDGENVTGIKLPQEGKTISLDTVSQELFDKDYSEIKRIRGVRERMTVRAEYVKQVKAGVSEGLATETRAVRGRATATALKNSGFKYNRWANKAREYLGKTPKEAAIKNTVETIEQVGGDKFVETGIKQYDDLSEELKKNGSRIEKFMEKNGGVFDKEAYVKQVSTDFTTGQKITEAANKVGVGLMIGTLACMANQAFSNVDEIAENNELAASRAAAALPAAQDQQIRGEANDEAIGAEANTLTGAENSQYYQYATGQEITAEEVEVPNTKPKYGNMADIISLATSPTTFIPGGFAIPEPAKDAINNGFCSALLDPKGAVVAAAAEIVVTAAASVFTGGGAAVARETGGRGALLVISRELASATLATGRGVVSKKSAATLLGFAAFQQGLEMVTRQLAGVEFMGGETGPQKFEIAAVGNNVLQSKRMRGIGGAPLTNEEAKQVDQPLIKQKTAEYQNQNVFARYLSIENPYSLIGKLSAIVPGDIVSLKQSSLTMVNSFASVFNIKNILNPVMSIAGLNTKAQAVDNYNPYYDVTQWGFSPSELKKMREDPTYNYYTNLDYISEETIAEYDEKYGDCFDTSKTNYEVEKMSKCSKDELRGNDQIFRYRLTLLDEETVSMLEQKPEDIGKDPVDDGGQNINSTGKIAPSGGSGSVGIEQTSPIPGTNKRIHTDVLPQFLDMIDAARADGIDLMPISSAWRDPQKQIELRKSNCPDWRNSPSGDCNPPTARPGTSKHESGRAVDFSNMCFSRNGSSSCKGNPRWEWLKANAATYGFYPLKSEAWHWSTTGT